MNLIGLPRKIYIDTVKTRKSLSLRGPGLLQPSGYYLRDFPKFQDVMTGQHSHFMAAAKLRHESSGYNPFGNLKPSSDEQLTLTNLERAFLDSLIKNAIPAYKDIDVSWSKINLPAGIALHQDGRTVMSGNVYAPTNAIQQQVSFFDLSRVNALLGDSFSSDLAKQYKKQFSESVPDMRPDQSHTLMWNDQEVGHAVPAVTYRWPLMGPHSTEIKLEESYLDLEAAPKEFQAMASRRILTGRQGINNVTKRLT